MSSRVKKSSEKTKSAVSVKTDTQFKVAAIVVLNHWLRTVGIKPITAWRYRRAGWLKTVNIAGRVYITQEAIEQFKQRAESGEFSKEHKTPLRKAA